MPVFFPAQAKDFCLPDIPGRHVVPRPHSFIFMFQTTIAPGTRCGYRRQAAARLNAGFLIFKPTGTKLSDCRCRRRFRKTCMTERGSVPINARDGCFFAPEPVKRRCTAMRIMLNYIYDNL